MTSTQPLLYAAESDITIERIRTLIRQVGPESPTVEYKEQMTSTIAKGVAALANTYGGLLLVGVTDDRQIKGVKEKTIAAVAEHCRAKTEPPWVPEIIPVPLGPNSDLYVLVLRIVPGRHPSPLLVDGVAYVRHQNTSYPADWQRLYELFTQGTAVEQDDIWDIRRPDIPLDAHGMSDKTVDLVIRSGMYIPISREARWRPLSERAVNAFVEALNRSPLSKALLDFAHGEAGSGGFNPFRRHGHNRSRTVQLQWWGSPDGWPSDKAGVAEATARLDVPGAYGDVTKHMLVQVDIIVRRSAIADLAWQSQKVAFPRWRVTAQRLWEAIQALVETLTDRAVVGPLADLAGIDEMAVRQPRILHLVTERPVTEVLDMAGLRQIPDAGVSKGAHLLADPALDLADPDDRGNLVRAWLVQIAQDAGLEGMEQLLERLAAEGR